MFSLIQFYEDNGIVKTHTCMWDKNKEVIEEYKLQVANALKDVGIEPLEVIATKNIQSMKEILKRSDIQIFQVVEDMKDI